jgi:hypothetical protein
MMPYRTLPIRRPMPGPMPVGQPIQQGGGAQAPMRPFGRPAGPMERPIASMKKGGKVKKTGTYKLHKGERVVKAKSKKSDTHAYVAGKRA